MGIERKVDVTPLYPRALDLFSDKYNAWGHLQKHVFDACEACSWGVLIPALQSALDTHRRIDLHDQARNGAADNVPADLTTIWTDFLELVAVAAERGVKLEWYWEEMPNPGDAPHKAFAPTGIFTSLDDQCVRTGFLPFKDDLPQGLATEQDRRYQLFLTCWKKVGRKWDNLLRAKRIQDCPASMRGLMSKVLSRADWDALS